MNTRLSRLLRPALTAALAVSTAAVARAQAQVAGSRSDERAFFRSLEELATTVAGTECAFRFRRVDYPEHGSEISAPERVQEGVVKLAYAPEGLWMEESFLELCDDEDFVAVPRVVTTYYSFVSGEYARWFRRPGELASQALIERWSGLPRIAFTAVGCLGAPSAVGQCELRESGLSSGPLARTVLRSPNGDDMTFEYTRDAAPRMVDVEVVSPDGTKRDWLLLDQHEERVEGWPAFPREITEGRKLSDGRTAHVTVWTAIDGDLARRAIERDVVQGTGVTDLRVDAHSALQSPTDRRIRLDRLLTWSGALDQPSDAPHVEYRSEAPAEAALAPAPEERDALWSWLLGSGLAASLAMLSLAALRGRRRPCSV